MRRRRSAPMIDRRSGIPTSPRPRTPPRVADTELAVAEHLNFRHAVSVLGVSLSSVSARVKTLEENLGVLLFERRARGLRDPANAGIRREPELPEHEEIDAPPRPPEQEFNILDDEPDVDAAKARALRQIWMVARQASLDLGDGIDRR